MSDVRDAAKKLNATILLKGPATVIAHPNGRCFIVNNGDQRLATAGTGDVNTGALNQQINQITQQSIKDPAPHNPDPTGYRLSVVPS